MLFTQGDAQITPRARRVGRDLVFLCELARTGRCKLAYLGTSPTARMVETASRLGFRTLQDSLQNSRYLHLPNGLDGIGLFRCKFLMHNPSMIYGYARVSTAAQDETGQVRQLKAAGCEKVFREKVTGTTADRPRLAALMKKLAPGRRGDNPGR
jgi:hypothetical protein